MTYTHEEILNALTLIQNICNTTLCSQCPFNNEFGECAITQFAPADWELNEPNPIWKAFK